MKYTKPYIQNLIKSNDHAAIRALLRVYDFQTDQEQLGEISFKRNGLGFNKVDSKILSPIAKQVLSKSYITEVQLELVRSRILKYSDQLTNWANKRLDTI